jgi:hypothetical protein
VRVEHRERALTDLVTSGGVAELDAAWTETLGRLLRATPLTDLATCARDAPAFAWSPATLALLGAPVTRTLALRALALGPEGDVDVALERATRALAESHPKEAGLASSLVAERAARLPVTSAGSS